jgi:hypothetical protein
MDNQDQTNPNAPVTNPTPTPTGDQSPAAPAEPTTPPMGGDTNTPASPMTEGTPTPPAPTMPGGAPADPGQGMAQDQLNQAASGVTPGATPMGGTPGGTPSPMAGGVPTENPDVTKSES